MDKNTLVKLEKGREHYEKREYDKAEPLLRDVAAETDGFADVMNMLGVIAHDHGDLEAAQRHFERAVKINPRYTEAALNLAVVYNEAGNYDKAKELYSRVTYLQRQESKEVEPFARGKLANMHAELGRAYAELGILQQAVSQYRSALELCPEFVDIRTRLGQTLKDAARLDEARVELELVRGLRPSYVPARVSLGVTYFAMGDRTAARREWEAVLELDPENKTAGMYLRMVSQLLAQEEAEALGMRVDVEQSAPAAVGDEEDELAFTFDGERSSVMPASSPSDEKLD